MEIQAIQANTALRSTVRAQETQEAPSAQKSAAPSGAAPAKPPAGGGGGPSKASGAAQSSSSSESTSSSNKIYDKKDANKDGKVSSAEEQQYALQHPGESDEASSENNSQNVYNQQGKAQDFSRGVASLIDILA
jgi:hypothetical protein